MPTPTDAAGAEPAIAADTFAPNLAGVSAFVAKVRDQLSLSAWWPGTHFAVSVTVLANFEGRGDINLAAVISDVSKNWVTCSSRSGLPVVDAAGVLVGIITNREIPSAPRTFQNWSYPLRG